MLNDFAVSADFRQAFRHHTPYSHTPHFDAEAPSFHIFTPFYTAAASQAIYMLTRGPFRDSGDAYRSCFAKA